MGRAGSQRTSRRRRTERAGWSPARWPRAGHEILAAGALAALLGTLLAVVAARAPARLAFAVDRAPAGVVWRNFYDLERNERGAFRWSKPEASLAIPVAAPGSYRVTLAL